RVCSRVRRRFRYGRRNSGKSSSPARTRVRFSLASSFLSEPFMRRPANWRIDSPDRSTAVAIHRRTFKQVVAAGLAAAQTAHPGSPPAGTPVATLKWPDQIYRRLLVDTHVPDSDPVLLSRFDPRDYVST